MESLPAPTPTGSKIDLPWKRIIPIGAGVAIAVIFVWLNVYLLTKTSASDLEWMRGVYLLNGLQSIGFAAAGFLLGNDLHRRRAEQAEKDLKSAQESGALAQLRATQAETRLEDLKKAILTYNEQLSYGRSVIGTVPMGMLVALVGELPSGEEDPAS